MSPFVLHLLLRWGGLVTGLWPHLQLLCVGLFWGLCCAVLSPSPLVAPSPYVVSRLGFLPLAFVRTWVGRLWSCLGSCLLLGELSFPCPSFHLANPAVWLSRLLEFSRTLCFDSFLSLPVFADSLGWLRMVLGLSALCSLAAEVVTLVLSVRYLSACPRGAMPLGASVLRCSWSSRWGHLSKVGTVFFLCPRSSRSLSLLLVGWVPGLSAGSPASGWRCGFRHALVLVAISPMYSFGMWSPFGSIVSFCHS